jgi:hypothetical protein
LGFTPLDVVLVEGVCAAEVADFAGAWEAGALELDEDEPHAASATAPPSTAVVTDSLRGFWSMRPS